MEVEKEAICGKKMIVFTIHGSKGPKKYLIGVQISKILHRQTFNLYRSLKLKGVEVERASPPQVGFLLRTQSLPPNTHSVSLVPYDGGKDFIIDNWKGEEVRKIPSCSTSRMGNLGPRKWSNQSPQPANLLHQPLHHHHRHHHLPSCSPLSRNTSHNLNLHKQINLFLSRLKSNNFLPPDNKQHCCHLEHTATRCCFVPTHPNDLSDEARHNEPFNSLILTNAALILKEFQFE